MKFLFVPRNGSERRVEAIYTYIHSWTYLYANINECFIMISNHYNKSLITYWTKEMWNIYEVFLVISVKYGKNGKSYYFDICI